MSGPTHVQDQAAPALGAATLPPPDRQFRQEYEGLWTPGCYCQIEVWLRADMVLIIATDASDDHQNTSVTNRIERVMYLAWERLGKPNNVFFAERYPRSPERLDFVEFPRYQSQLMAGVCYAYGRSAGYQFGTPKWQSAVSYVPAHPELQQLFQEAAHA